MRWRALLVFLGSSCVENVASELCYPCETDGDCFPRLFCDKPRGFCRVEGVERCVPRDAGEDSGVDAGTNDAGTTSIDAGAPDAGPVLGVDNRIIFITDRRDFDGELGGLDGADLACESEAAGRLPGRYRAWLSTKTSSVAGRFTRSTRPYVRPDGVVIANNWDDLTDGVLSAHITMTASGDRSDKGNVFTNTLSNGAASTNDCNGWQLNTMALRGGTGNYMYNTYRWTQGTAMTCNQRSFRLYCVQQD